MTGSPRSSDLAGADSAGISAPSILVVEDDLPLARLMEALLQSAGYGVRLVRDGEAALAALASDPPALILLDLTLPTIDGWEVLARLRGQRGSPPVILFTAQYAVAERALSAGAAAAVLKPFDVDHLLATVERLLGA